MGVDMIEFDVQLTKDAELAVIHDWELDRTTDVRGKVRDWEWDALSDIDCGSWFGTEFAGQRILRLQDVIELLNGRAAMNVELKSQVPDQGLLAERVIEVLSKYEAVAGSTLISSFDVKALDSVRACSAEARLGLLWMDPDISKAWNTMDKLGAVAFHPYFEFVDEAVIEEARRRELEVNVWTVNGIEDMLRMATVGVRGIISDYPERFQNVRKG